MTLPKVWLHLFTFLTDNSILTQLFPAFFPLLIFNATKPNLNLYHWSFSSLFNSKRDRFLGPLFWQFFSIFLVKCYKIKTPPACTPTTKDAGPPKPRQRLKNPRKHWSRQFQVQNSETPSEIPAKPTTPFSLSTTPASLNKASPKTQPKNQTNHKPTLPFTETTVNAH